jgi:hypothetical protein
MMPAGYNAKLIAKPEPWLGSDVVTEILSVSECFSESPIDHTALWLCNSWQLYDSLEALEQALAQTPQACDCLPRRFFYEVHPEALVDGRWTAIEGMPTSVARPATGWRRKGFDVVCMDSVAAGPNCSPLSCNSGAKVFEVNSCCSLETLEQAILAAQTIEIDGGYEPGPYGVMSVWEIDNERP